MPIVSEAQRRFMHATAEGKTDAPKSVGEEFISKDKPGKLPERVKKDAGMSNLDKIADALGRLDSDAEILNRRMDEHLGFHKLEGKLAGHKGVYDPAGLAAAIGRKKFGKKRMEKKAAAGR